MENQSKHRTNIYIVFTFLDELKSVIYNNNK